MPFFMRRIWLFASVFFAPTAATAAGGALAPDMVVIEVDAAARAHHVAAGQSSKNGGAALLRREVVGEVASSNKGHRRSTATVTETEPIPNIVFFTGPWEPQALVNANRQLVPAGTEFRYYDDQMMARSALNLARELEKVGVAGAFNAFTSLRPAAYRADLWRYMYLWAYGGVYLDAKMKLKSPISEWLTTRADNELVMCGDLTWPEHVWTGVLAAPPKNPQILQVIREVVANVKGRSYGTANDGIHADLMITGPGAVTKALMTAGGSYFQACILKRDQPGQSPHVVRSPEQNPTVAEFDEDVHSALRKGNDYAALHKAHQVYCEESGPPCASYHETALSLGGVVGKDYWSEVV